MMLENQKLKIIDEPKSEPDLEVVDEPNPEPKWKSLIEIPVDLPAKLPWNYCPLRQL